MSSFQAIQARAGSQLRTPPKIIELPLSAWAEAPNKPTTPMKMGLHPPSEDAQQRADIDALQEADIRAAGQPRDEWIRMYNDAVIREVLFVSVSLAVDVTKPFFESPLEITRRLTTEGMRRLWQELEILRLGMSPALPEADDAGFAHLDAILIRGIAWQFVPPEEARMLRRLLEHCRQQLAAAEEAAEKRGFIIAAEG